jgi:hypothetical protein
MYTMESPSGIRNNDMWFEGKWIQVEDTMPREASQALKDNGCMFSAIRGR